MAEETTPAPSQQGKLVFIPALGSLGDVWPYVALARRLHKMGYKIRLGTHLRYKDVTDMKDFEWVEMRGDLEWTLANTPEGKEMSKNPSIFNFGLVKAVFYPLIESWFDDIMKHSEGADLIVMGLVCWLAGFSALEKYPNLKAVGIFTYPSTPTWEFAPPTIGKSESWFGWVNALKWTAADKGAGTLYENELNRHRARYNLPPLKDNIRDHFSKLRNPHPITLTAYSVHLLPRPKDWPDHTDMTPPLFPEPDERPYDPPADLLDFLDASKPKPIYIGVGSMMGSMLERPEQLKIVREWLTGLRYARTRAIISLSGMDAADRDQFKNNDSVYFVQSFIPHRWLFPKITAVVHHGGAGTTHTGLYYGLPTLIMPFGADQPFNGDRVFINKLGPEPIPIRDVTAANFSAAVQKLVGDKTFATNAERVGELLRREDGVGTAAQAIADTLAGKHVRAPVLVIPAQQK